MGKIELLDSEILDLVKKYRLTPDESFTILLETTLKIGKLCGFSNQAIILIVQKVLKNG